MTSKRSAILGAILACSTMMSTTASFAQISGDVIKIGIMNDQSGPYADNCGPGSVEAARMAVEDFGGSVDGKPVEIVIADDQNKPDVGVAVAQKWVDQEGVDAIVGCSASSIALAIQEIMGAKKKPYLIAGSASSAFTNDKCNAYTTQWILDTNAMAKGAVKLLTDAGHKKFYFITVDYTFGKQWQADATAFIEAAGGQVVGSVLHPLNTTDFSSYLLQAQASGADTVILASAGADFMNAQKQSIEFGLQAGGQTVASLGRQISEINGAGLAATQGMILATPIYWDLNDETRAFADRFRKRFRDRTPNESMMGTYSAVNHLLQSIKAAGSDEGDAVMAKMREIPVNDFEMKDVKIRADGQVMRPWYAVKVKTPEESKYPFDYYEVTGTIAPEDVWRAPADSKCDLLKN